MQGRPSPFEVPLPRLPYLDRESVANIQGLGSIPTARLERKLGEIPSKLMTQVTAAPRLPLTLNRFPNRTKPSLAPIASAWLRSSRPPCDPSSHAFFPVLLLVCSAAAQNKPRARDLGVIIEARPGHRTPSPTSPASKSVTALPYDRLQEVLRNYNRLGSRRQ
jgi:hypothetical protein